MLYMWLKLWPFSFLKLTDETGNGFLHSGIHEFEPINDQIDHISNTYLKLDLSRYNE